MAATSQSVILKNIYLLSGNQIAEEELQELKNEAVDIDDLMVFREKVDTYLDKYLTKK